MLAPLGEILDERAKVQLMKDSDGFNVIHLFKGNNEQINIGFKIFNGFLLHKTRKVNSNLFTFYFGFRQAGSLKSPLGNNLIIFILASTERGLFELCSSSSMAFSRRVFKFTTLVTKARYLEELASYTLFIYRKAYASRFLYRDL